MKNQTRITSPVYLIEPQSELAERAKYFSPGVVTYKSENLSGFLKKKKISIRKMQLFVRPLEDNYPTKL